MHEREIFMRSNRAKLAVVVVGLIGAMALIALVTVRPSSNPSLSTQIGSFTDPPGDSAQESTQTSMVDSPLESPTVLPVEKIDWMTQYHQTEDLYAFATDAARAAVEGDARAQYALSQALLNCDAQVKMLGGPSGSSGVPQAIEDHLTRVKGVLEQDRVSFRRNALRCERFFNENALENLSLAGEARSYRYWFDKAVDAGDPLALMERASRTALRDRAADDAATEVRQAVLDDVRVAVESREGAALARVGWLYTQAALVGDNNKQGFAWLVAACAAGYDCSNTNPEIGRGCAEAGTCQPGQSILDVLQRDLGSSQYAAVYASGQDILYKVRAGDWAGLQQYLEMRM